MQVAMEFDNSDMIVKRVCVPVGLEELMEGLTKEVLLKKPKDLYVFASEYFAKLLVLREKGLYGQPVKYVQSVTKQSPKHHIQKVVSKKSNIPKNISQKSPSGNAISKKHEEPPKSSREELSTQTKNSHRSILRNMSFTQKPSKGANQARSKSTPRRAASLDSQTKPTVEPITIKQRPARKKQDNSRLTTNKTINKENESVWQNTKKLTSSKSNEDKYKKDIKGHQHSVVASKLLERNLLNANSEEEIENKLTGNILQTDKQHNEKNPDLNLHTTEKISADEGEKQLISTGETISNRNSQQKSSKKSNTELKDSFTNETDSNKLQIDSAESKVGSNIQNITKGSTFISNKEEEETINNTQLNDKEVENTVQSCVSDSTEEIINKTQLNAADEEVDNKFHTDSTNKLKMSYDVPKKSVEVATMETHNDKVKAVHEDFNADHVASSQSVSNDDDTTHEQENSTNGSIFLNDPNNGAKKLFGKDLKQEIEINNGDEVQTLVEKDLNKDKREPSLCESKMDGTIHAQEYNESKILTETNNETTVKYSNINCIEPSQSVQIIDDTAEVVDKYNNEENHLDVSEMKTSLSATQIVHSTIDDESTNKDTILTHANSEDEVKNIEEKELNVNNKNSDTSAQKNSSTADTDKTEAKETTQNHPNLNQPSVTGIIHCEDKLKNSPNADKTKIADGSSVSENVSEICADIKSLHIKDNIDLSYDNTVTNMNYPENKKGIVSEVTKSQGHKDESNVSSSTGKEKEMNESVLKISQETSPETKQNNITVNDSASNANESNNENVSNLSTISEKEETADEPVGESSQQKSEQFKLNSISKTISSDNLFITKEKKTINKVNSLESIVNNCDENNKRIKQENNYCPNKLREELNNVEEENMILKKINDKQDTLNEPTYSTAKLREELKKVEEELIQNEVEDSKQGSKVDKITNRSTDDKNSNDKFSGTVLEVNAVRKIQRFWRKHSNQQKYIVKNVSSTQVSSSEKKQENHYTSTNKLLLNAVIKIQSMWRGFSIRRKKNHHITKRHIQTESLDQTNLNNSAIKIQSLWRAYKVRSNLRKISNRFQKGERESSVYKEESGNTSLVNAATKIQAGFRGYTTRKKLSERKQSGEPAIVSKPDMNKDSQKLSDLKADSPKKVDNNGVKDITKEDVNVINEKIHMKQNISIQNEKIDLSDDSKEAVSHISEGPGEDLQSDDKDKSAETIENSTTDNNNNTSDIKVLTPLEIEVKEAAEKLLEEIKQNPTTLSKQESNNDINAIVTPEIHSIEARPISKDSTDSVVTVIFNDDSEDKLNHNNKLQYKKDLTSNEYLKDDKTELHESKTTSKETPITAPNANGNSLDNLTDCKDNTPTEQRNSSESEKFEDHKKHEINDNDHVANVLNSDDKINEGMYNNSIEDKGTQPKNAPQDRVASVSNSNNKINEIEGMYKNSNDEEGTEPINGLQEKESNNPNDKITTSIIPNSKKEDTVPDILDNMDQISISSKNKENEATKTGTKEQNGNTFEHVSSELSTDAALEVTKNNIKNLLGKTDKHCDENDNKNISETLQSDDNIDQENKKDIQNYNEMNDLEKLNKNDFANNAVDVKNQNIVHNDTACNEEYKENERIKVSEEFPSTLVAMDNEDIKKESLIGINKHNIGNIDDSKNILETSHKVDHVVQNGISKENNLMINNTKVEQHTNEKISEIENSLYNEKIKESSDSHTQQNEKTAHDLLVDNDTEESEKNNFKIEALIRQCGDNEMRIPEKDQNNDNVNDLSVVNNSENTGKIETTLEKNIDLNNFISNSNKESGQSHIINYPVNQKEMCGIEDKISDEDVNSSNMTEEHEQISSVSEKNCVTDSNTSVDVENIFADNDIKIKTKTPSVADNDSKQDTESGCDEVKHEATDSNMLENTQTNENLRVADKSNLKDQICGESETNASTNNIGESYYEDNKNPENLNISEIKGLKVFTNSGTDIDDVDSSIAIPDIERDDNKNSDESASSNVVDTEQNNKKHISDDENIKSNNITSNKEKETKHLQVHTEEPPELPTVQTKNNSYTDKSESHQLVDSNIETNKIVEAGPSKNISTADSDTIKLIHTGEFHDSLVVPESASVSNVCLSGSIEQTVKRTPTPPDVKDEEELQNTPLTVQLNNSPGAEILTSQEMQSDSDSETSSNTAQASAKGASSERIHSAIASSPNRNSNSMEIEKPSDASTASQKNMEVEAATKIQAGFRGYQVRKQLKIKNGSTDISNQRRSDRIRRKSSGKMSDTGRVTQTKSKDTTDQDEKEKSAVKIQAGVRGFLVRRRQKKNKE